MRVLIEKEDRIRKDSTCVYFAKAFGELCEVIEVYPEELPLVKEGTADLYVRIDYGVDNPFPKHLKPSVYYAIDTHIDLDWRIKMAKEADFDYVFCAQKRGADEDWHVKAEWLPLACDPETHYSPINYAKLYDVCFIGNTAPWRNLTDRIEVLDRLFKGVPNFYVGNKYFGEATRKYKESNVVFNYAFSDDINMRVFEAMASGSCLLTDKKEWHGLFCPGHHFFEYDKDDMLTKMYYLLDNPQRREQVAKQGQEEVLKNHTYKKRAQRILDLCV